jgi:alpha-L-fucosidase
MPRGGILQAAVVTPEGRLGMIASRYYAGLVPTGWKVVDTETSAKAAIDGDPSTLWLAAGGTGEAPIRITVDMGNALGIRGFTYLPRRDGKPDGVVELYRFETSTDGINWTTNVDSGRFDNIRNNPVLQEVTFTPTKARFFRFTVLKDIDGKARMSVAEISVLPSA